MLNNWVYKDLQKDMSKKGFVLFPKAVLLDERLSNEAKILFAYIRSLSDKFRHLRNRTLRKKLGVSLNTLQKCKNELVEYNYLLIHRGQSSNYYQVKLSPDSLKSIQSDSLKIKQSDYPKNRQHYKSNNKLSDNKLGKRRAKGFKKFNE